MKAQAFLNLIEVRTKTASLLPYAAGTLYAVYRFDTFSTLNAVLMLVSLLCIDMATTVLNNFLEARSERSVVFIGGMKYSKSTVTRLIMLLLVLGILSGGWLGYRHGPVVWFIGVIAFFTAIVYSAGPLPIQRTVLGEFFSGLFMGFGIFFLACFIHMDNSTFQLYTFGDRLVLDVSMTQLRSFIFVGLPFATAISNVMLANNICDMAADEKNRRFTLPVSLGRPDSLFLFILLYFLGAIGALLAVIFRDLPLWGLLMVFPYGLVLRNASQFNRNPDKVRTFPLAVKNLNIIGIAMILVIAAGLLTVGAQG